MARMLHAFAVALVVAAAPLAAATAKPTVPGPSPSDGPDVRYCMRIAAITGTYLERVRCWTRAEWTDQGVDVDKDWPKEGVAIRR